MYFDSDRISKSGNSTHKAGPSFAASLQRLGQTVSAAVLNTTASAQLWVASAVPQPEDAGAEAQFPPGEIRHDLRKPSGQYRPDPAGPVLTVEIALTDAGGTPLVGHAVDLWHCDAHGSAEADDTPDATWLRGIGISDDTGIVRFTTVVPGCIVGHVPHMWLEVWRSADGVNSGESALMSTMVALPLQTCAHVYAADLNNTHGTENLNRLLLSSEVGLGGDMPDAPEMVVTGSAAAGYVGKAELKIDPVAERSVPKLKEL